MYHVIYNLERMFASLEECQTWLDHLVLTPRIPKHIADGEDGTTPRICVARSVEDCITGIDLLGAFRRCCKSNSTVYCGCGNENNTEAYPIAIIKLPDNLNYHKPSIDDVPDVEDTGEYWLLEQAVPVRTEIRWMDAFSLHFYWIDDDWDNTCVCEWIRFVDDKLAKYDHPWLNGQGHTLDGKTLLPETFRSTAA